MKKILLIPFLLLQISIYSQSNAQWSIGAEFSTDFLSISDDSDGIDFIKMDGILGYYIHFDQYNYRFGFTTDYSFEERWGISSGILYSNKDFTGTYACELCNMNFSSVPEKIEQRFLTVPVSINFSLLKGNFKPIVKGGLKNNLEIKNDLNKKSKGYFLEAFIGASVNYRFSEIINAGIGYDYQTAITDLYKTDEYNLKTSSLFLQINFLLN